MSYDPAIVGHYGKLVETWATSRYDVELDYPTVGGKKFDATGPAGQPIDVKGAMVNGVRPTFKFWKDSHGILRRERGIYLLVWYRAEGREISIVASRSIRADDLEITNWTNPGPTHYRSDTKEAQIPAPSLRP